jgi:hypothetical protein
MSENKKDTHGSPAITRWVHHHRRMARWLLRFLVTGTTALLFYLRSQEKIVDQEIKHDK